MKFIIAEHVDPYHAKSRYNCEKVLKYDGGAPVKWVYDDLDFDSLLEARENLFAVAVIVAGEHRSEIRHEDDESIKNHVGLLRSYGRLDEAIAGDLFWYRGEGIYRIDTDEPVMLKGWESFCYDGVFYEIEEAD